MRQQGEGGLNERGQLKSPSPVLRLPLLPLPLSLGPLPPQPPRSPSPLAPLSLGEGIGRERTGGATTLVQAGLFEDLLLRELHDGGRGRRSPAGVEGWGAPKGTWGLVCPLNGIAREGGSFRGGGAAGPR